MELRAPMNMNPRTTRTVLTILAVAVAALVAFHLLTREEYEDSARQLIQRETVTKP
jgi:hypothetical protein